MPNPANEISRGAKRIKITKRAVDSRPAGAARAIWYDDRLAGFGVRVMPSGRRSYFVRYRNKHGRDRWFTIGEHGKVTADAARARRSASCRRWRSMAAILRANGKPSGRLPLSTSCSIATSPPHASENLVTSWLTALTRRDPMDGLSSANASALYCHSSRAPVLCQKDATYVLQFARQRRSLDDGTSRRPSRVNRYWLLVSDRARLQL
jgi:hypothetical protein